jgi:hypothetical protein
MNIVAPRNVNPIVDLSSPEQVAVVAKLTNLLFAVVDEPELGAERFSRAHLLHSCKLAVSIIESER